MSGETLGGHILLGGILGEGGMGVVYYARSRFGNREYAVKIPYLAPEPEPGTRRTRRDVDAGFRPGPDSDPRERQREELWREVRAYKRLSSRPGVVGVGEHDFSKGARPPYMALEFIDGVDLHTARWNQPGHRYGDVAALTILGDVTDSLADAYELGIAHRDVKPGNVLMPRHGRAKVSDFGMSRIATDSHLYGKETVFGTPAYMAPEAAAGEPDIDYEKADVYSAGVMLAELVLGEHPRDIAVPGADGQALVEWQKMRGLHTGFRAEAILQRIQHPAVRSLVRAATERDPAARISMREFSDRAILFAHETQFGNAAPPERIQDAVSDDPGRTRGGRHRRIRTAEANNGTRAQPPADQVVRQPAEPVVRQREPMEL